MDGHWITEEKGCNYRIICCICNKEAINKVKSNYCPHCGAHMTEAERKVNKSIKSIPKL